MAPLTAAAPATAPAASRAVGGRRAPRMLLRYITAQVGGAAVLGLVTLTVFVSAVDFISNVGGELKDGIPLHIVWRLQLLRLPDTVLQVAWVAMLNALLFVLGQLARRREYVAVLAGGVSIFQISGPCVFVAVLLSVGVFGLQEGVSPAAREALAGLRGMYARDGEGDLRGTIEDVSYYASENRTYVIKYLNADEGAAYQIQMHRTEEPGIVESLQAAAGTWDASRRRWIWRDAVVRTFDADQRVLTEERYPERVSRLRASPTELRIEKRLALDKYNLSYMSIAQLRRRIETLARSDQAPRGLYVAYYAKWSEPWAPVVIALLAIPGALSVNRSGLVRGIVLCVAACVGVFALRHTGLAMGRGGLLPPVVAAWLPHGVAGLGGIVWLHRAPT